MRKGKYVALFLSSVALITMLTSCSGANGMNVKVTKLDYKKEFEENREINEGNSLNEIEVSIDVGNVNVSHSTDDTFKISVTYNASAKSEKDLEDIMNSVELSTVQEDNHIGISIVKKDSDENVWDWLDKNMENNYNLSADINIAVPKTVSEYTINNDTGNISLENLEGIFCAVTDTGNVYAREIVFQDKSTLQTDTGNIELKLDEKSVVNKSDVTISTDTGNIVIALNDSRFEELEREGDGVSMKRVIEVESKCKIHATTDTGSITIR